MSDTVYVSVSLQFLLIDIFRSERFLASDSRITSKISAQRHVIFQVNCRVLTKSGIVRQILV
jgi:hypothetical protein